MEPEKGDLVDQKVNLNALHYICFCATKEMTPIKKVLLIFYLFRHSGRGVTRQESLSQIFVSDGTQYDIPRFFER